MGWHDIRDADVIELQRSVMPNKPHRKKGFLIEFIIEAAGVATGHTFTADRDSSALLDCRAEQSRAEQSRPRSAVGQLPTAAECLVKAYDATIDLNFSLSLGILCSQALTLGIQ